MLYKAPLSQKVMFIPHMSNLSLPDGRDIAPCMTSHEGGTHLLYTCPGPSSDGSEGARLYSCCIHAMSSARPAERSNPVF